MQPELPVVPLVNWGATGSSRLTGSHGLPLEGRRAAIGPAEGRKTMPGRVRRGNLPGVKLASVAGRPALPRARRADLS